MNMHKTSGKNKALSKIFLVTSDHINSFPLEDPDHPYAGWQFLSDCDKLGYPSIKVGANWYVFASEAGR
jgi:hypothetical protein